MGDLIKSIGAAAGDTGKTKLKRYTLWPSISGDIESSLEDARDLRTSSKNTLADWVTDYLNPQARTKADQEISFLDSFYNRGYGNQLGALSRDQTAAERAMLEAGAAAATRGWKGSMAGGEGGLGSYNRRALSAVLAPYYAQFATNEANRNRANFDTVTGMQLSNLGRRTALDDAVIGRPLNAMELERNLFSGDLNNLTSLLNLYKANTPYGFQYKPSGTEKAGDIVDGLISAAASVYGMGAGGGMMGGAGGAGGGGLLSMFGGGGGGNPNAVQFYGGGANAPGAFASGAGPLSLPAANTWTSNLWNAGAGEGYFPLANPQGYYSAWPSNWR